MRENFDVNGAFAIVVRCTKSVLNVVLMKQTGLFSFMKMTNENNVFFLFLNICLSCNRKFNLT